MMLERGDVIERPGPWPTQHRGIFAGWDGFGRGWVIHNPKGGCVKYDLLEVFAERQQVKRIAQPVGTAYERNSILARAHSQLGKPYDILNFNCEHLVTYALGGASSSPQLQAVTVCLALIVGLGMVFGR